MMFASPLGTVITQTLFGSVKAGFSSLRSDFGADSGRVLVSGFGYGYAHILPTLLRCHSKYKRLTIWAYHKKRTTRMINKTDNDMEIREFRGLITDTNHYIRMAPVKANPDRITNIDTTKYSGGDVYGGQPSKLMIFCNGSCLKSRSGTEVELPGQYFIDSKTVTIETVAEDRNVVNYKVTFQPRVASAKTTPPLEVLSDSVLNHDNGWSVHCNNGSVKLTRKEGMTMTLDPSKLFATVVDPAETSLLNEVLKFWPRTFADLNCKDDLGRTICIVNDLMRQAKLCHVDESKVEVDKVVKNVRDLHKSCAAMVEWYRPLFPKMKDRFPQVASYRPLIPKMKDRFPQVASYCPLIPKMKDRFPQVAETMAVDDREKLKKFETTIKDMLRSS